jgi:D-glycero-alpha-D-manno-heptose-7-phosphate kinase
MRAAKLLCGERAWRARAPVRIDFAGGTTDLPAYAEREGGAVVNATIARYAYATARPTAGQGVRLRSQDLDEYVTADSVRELEFDGHLDLVKAAVQRMGLEGGFEIAVRCDAPRGSGLGASASVAVAVVGLLAALRAAKADSCEGLASSPSPTEIAELACQLEARLGIVGGKQDQYAAALGGFNYMQFCGSSVHVQSLDLAPELICELEKHLILCYTGQSRLSGETNQRMISAYEAGEQQVVASLATIKELAGEVAHCLCKGDLAALPELLNAEWAAREKLAAGVATPAMYQQRAAACAAGALAAKICGAGGGGCILFYCAPDREAEVRRALIAAGGQPLDFVFTSNGLTVWTSAAHGAA